MTRKERLADMSVYVKNGKMFHLKDIMDKYEISNRTAKRDIHDLKESGLKIFSYPCPNGGCQVIDDKSTYCVFLKRKEIELIRYALPLMDIDDQGVDTDEIGALMDKLGKFL